ncbi:MAG: DUF3887 domain-containing protein [Candidatus Riflebacteria bacterium]|nr:DUF3887 domain-containing protein [Candidatus Riflebacteria bacterium]
MNRIIYIFVIIAIFNTPSIVLAVEEPELYKVAETFIDLLSQRNFEQAANAFDNKVKQLLPPEKLQEAWESVIRANGALKNRTVNRFEKARGFEVIYITCEFERANLDAKVVFDESKKIAGLIFLDSDKPKKFVYLPPSYADTSKFSDQEVTIGTGAWKLPGTLTIPQGTGSFPLLILVHGSGPQDRDETIGPNKPFCDLAGGLGTKGIATLRYEKRTRHYGQAMAKLKNEITVNEETVQDAIEAVKTAHKISKIDPKKIFLLGHSLGGNLVPRIAQKDPSINGFIIMAGYCRPFEDLILAQMKYIFSLDSHPSEEKKKYLQRLEEQVALVKSNNLKKNTPAEKLPLEINANYWLDLRGYAPEKVAATINRPFFVIQGGRDYQVTSEDFGIWQSALLSHSNATFKLYPTLNHIFIHGNEKATPSDYDKPGHFFEPVITDIANWIKSAK